MPEASASSTWRAVQEERVRLLHQHIAGYQQLMAMSRTGSAPSGEGADAASASALLAQACAPCYRMLEEIYREDLPLADTLDRADLVARMEGPAVSTPSLPLAVVTALLTDMQTQLSAMVRTIASGLAPGLEWPRDLEFRLSSFARGSLYLGFELPQPPEGSAFMRGDPFEQAARDSLQVLGVASRLAGAEAPLAEVIEALPDPHIRDASLSAVERLSPTGRRGIMSLSLTGRCFGDQSWRRLTPETRHRVRAWIDAGTVSRREPVTLQGVVRQVDLDQRCFDLRLSGSAQPGATAPLVRCRYLSPLDREAKTWLDRRVEVQGEADLFDGKPRLVHVHTLSVRH